MKNITTGVMLLNLGGPDSITAIKPFLYNLFSDRKIIRLGPAPFQKPLAWLISTIRAPKTAGYYKQIGGMSPILPATQAQAGALETRLREHGDFRVLIGMRYWRPFVADTLQYAASEGIRRIVALSLYPQYSAATTGSSEDALREALAAHPDVACAYIQTWFDHPLYIEALVGLLSQSLAASPGAHVLFSAHSLPIKFIDEGDPYEREVRGTVGAVMRRINAPHSLAYQSKAGPVAWLEPSTGEELERLAGMGVREVVVVPVSFVSDHIETLYEIDILYKGIADGLGINLRRIGSLNTHPLFIKALEDMVLGKAREMAWL